jgi:hypothetical protein
MRIAVVGIEPISNKTLCFDVIYAETLEGGISVAESIYANTDKFTFVECVDADAQGISGPSAIKLDGTWYDLNSVKVLGWDYIRGQRQPLLYECDWTQLSDAPLSAEKKIEWANYRNELRNLTEAFEQPEDVVFPTKPE